MCNNVDGGVNRTKFITLKSSLQSHISCHFSKQNLVMGGISSQTGSFTFVTGKGRADMAAISAPYCCKYQHDLGPSISKLFCYF